MMNSLGINQGVSGNISARQDDGAMIITPTGIPYDTLDPADLVTLTFTGHYQGPLRPSSEWRIHGAIYQNHPEIHAVVHAHPLFATALAIQHISIPAIHYMVAIGGGDDIPCADYATFGTETLARNVLSALEERTVCLMEHHGLIATGPSLSVAMDRAVQTETLARQFVIAGLLGNPRILPQEEMTRVLNKLGDYGLRSKSDSISGEGGKP
jgi:L-fuculose-phosphate aldolase